MAQIYGRPGVENNLLNNCPPEINSFDDIKPTTVKYINDLEQKRKTFFEKLPELIQKEKDKLVELQKNRIDIEVYWNEKINSIKKSLELKKWQIWKYVDIFFKEYVSKPKAIKNAENNIEIQKNFINKLEHRPETVFAKEQSVLINNINLLERNINSPDYSGAYGEIQVCNELKKLDNNYHIFCDVKVTLGDYIRYHNVRNLKTAQMDFVVVGPTGIFIIEVKNRGIDYLKQHYGLSPYEQVDRASLVLWVYLKQHSFFFKPRITKVLVSIQHNLEYNSYYKSVLVKDVNNIRQFICKNFNVLSDSEIRKVVSLLN